MARASTIAAGPPPCTRGESRDRLDVAQSGKLFAAEPELVQQLQPEGLYHVADRRARYLPLTLDRKKLVIRLRADDLNPVVEPIRPAIAAAAASVASIEALVSMIRECESTDRGVTEYKLGCKDLQS